MHALMRVSKFLSANNGISPQTGALLRKIFLNLAVTKEKPKK